MLLRKTSTKTLLTFVFGTLLFARPLAAEPPSCSERYRLLGALQESLKTSTELHDALAATKDWQSLVHTLESVTPENLRHPLRVGSLPVAARSYENASFVVGHEPMRSLSPGQRIVSGPIEFAYGSGSEKKTIGYLSYVVLGSDGKVVEVGGGSREVIAEFKSHVFGRTMSAQEIQTISDINRKFIDTLRRNPILSERVKEFAKKRGWPESVAQKGRIAYFDDDVVSVKQWAKQNGYRFEQMRDAGWLRLQFDQDGTAIFKVNQPNSIKIPFFADSDRFGISIWRTRQVETRDPNAPKYLSWPLDRSLDRHFTANEELYNSWDLQGAQGKTVVITEGEFKSLVAQETTGVTTVGIRGITEFDDTVAQALVRADAKDYVVILDRDPKASGLMRVDNISDSERAAYSIARQLQAAGAKNVRVGTLPNAFNGGKVGIDDLILAKGNEPFLKTIADSVEPGAYAQKIGLNEDFQEIGFRRQQLKRAIERYSNAHDRGAPAVASEIEKRARDHLETLNQAFADHLFRRYNRAQGIGQASADHSSLSRINRIPNVEHKAFFLKDGTALNSSDFSDEVLLLDYASPRIQAKGCKPAPCVTYPSETREEIEADVARGLEIANHSGFAPKTQNDMASVSLSGRLTEIFPADDYRYDFNVSLALLHGREHSPYETIPLVIRKKSSGRVVAIAQLRSSKDPKQLEQDGQRMQRILGFLRQ